MRNRTQLFIRLREEKSHKIHHTGSDTLPSSSGYSYISAKNLLEKQPEDPGQQTIINVPPDWLARVSEVQYELGKIKTKMADLSEKHKKHLLPGFDDRQDEEHGIEILTGDITKLFRQSQAKIQQIGEDKLTAEEKKLKKNVQTALATQLQELSVTFRQNQKSYLQTLQGRISKKPTKSGNKFIDFEADVTYEDTGFTPEQLALVNDMDAQISQRERDILKIAKSISELAEIFQDLATLVDEQGTILDRIDYNLEQTNMYVDDGVNALVGAAKEQKKYRTKLCILLLLLLVFCMVIVVVIKAVIK